MKKEKVILSSVVLGATTLVGAGAVHADQSSLAQNSETVTNQSVSTKTSDVKDAQTQVNQDQSKVNADKQNVNRDQNQVNDAQSQVNKAQKDADNASSQTPKVEGQIKDTQSEVVSDQNKISTDQNQLNNDQSAAKNAQNQVNTDQQNVSDKQNAVKDAQSKVNADNQRINDIHHAQQIADQAQQKVNDDQQDVSSKQSDANDAKNVLTTAQNNANQANQSVASAQGNVTNAQNQLNNDQSTLANDQKMANDTQGQINDVQDKLNNTDSLSLTSGATFSQSKYEDIVNQYNSDHNLTEEDSALNQMMAPGPNDDSTPLEGGSYHQEVSLDGQTFNPANQQLTNAQQEALADYVASLINALRAKYNPSAPKVQVSTGMLQRMRTEINQVNADGKTGVMSQTDWNAQQKAFGNMDTEEWLGNVGLEWDGSNWTANHNFTMNQIYQNTFNVLQKYLQRDYQDEGQLGAVGLLGATCYRNEQGTYKMVPNEYLGVDIDNGGGLHIVTVFDNPTLPVESDVQTGATTPDEFNTTTLQNQLDNLKQTLASQQAKVNQDQNVVNQDQNALSAAQSALKAAQNTQSHMANALSTAQNNYNQAKADLTAAQNQLAKDQAVLAQAENDVKNAPVELAAVQQQLASDQQAATNANNALTAAQNQLSNDQQALKNAKDKVVADQQTITNDQNQLSQDETTLKNLQQQLTNYQNAPQNLSQAKIALAQAQQKLTNDQDQLVKDEAQLRADEAILVAAQKKAQANHVTTSNEIGNVYPLKHNSQTSVAFHNADPAQTQATSFAKRYLGKNEVKADVVDPNVKTVQNQVTSVPHRLGMIDSVNSVLSSKKQGVKWNTLPNTGNVKNSGMIFIGMLDLALASIMTLFGVADRKH